MPDASVVDTLTIDVDTLKDEKLDSTHMDEDIHFGPVTITKEGTAVIASFDAINPVTGESTPMSILLPGATSTDAGVMDASSVAWIEEAEGRISALEGLSDVKALVGLSATPTQTEINTEWMDATNKPPETGDLVQDVSNSKLWVYVTDTWILYGTRVTVPLATTNSLGGVKDTALNAPANRWYSHVEADGRLSLIGGDSLSTLLDTTIPGISTHVSKMDNPHGVTKAQVGLGSYPTSPADIGISTAVQTALDGKVGKTGDEDITGIKNFENSIAVGMDRNGPKYTTFFNSRVGITYEDITAGMTGGLGGVTGRGSGLNNTHLMTYEVGGADSSIYHRVRRPNADNVTQEARSRLYVNSDGEGWMIIPMRSTPGATDAVHTKYVLDRVDEIVGYVNDQDMGKQDKFSLYEHTIRIWTTTATDEFRFSLTVLNQSPTEFTLPTLRVYLGTANTDFKQCTGVYISGGGGALRYLTAVRGGGTTTAFVCDGVNVSTGTIDRLVLDWLKVEVLIADKVRQIV